MGTRQSSGRGLAAHVRMGRSAAAAARLRHRLRWYCTTFRGFRVPPWVYMLWITSVLWLLGVGGTTASSPPPPPTWADLALPSLLHSAAVD